MSAIITENFRRNNTRLFLNDITNPTNGRYYLGIGKQDRWVDTEENIDFSVPVPVGTHADALEVLNNLSTLVALNAVNGIGRVIPTVSWKETNIYQEYSSYDSSRFYPSSGKQPCYVTINGAIFLCLKAGSGASTFSPTFSESTKYEPLSLNDGYIWVLVQEAPQQIIRNNTFTDIRTTPLTGTEETNSTTQCGGIVTGFTIVNGGTGYTSSSVLRLRVNDGFVLNDDGADRSSTFVQLNFELGAEDSIINVSFPSGWPSSAAKGARFASIEFSGPGSGAVIVPTIAPTKGFAYDPSAVMPSWFAGIAINLDDSILGDNFYSRYRQISIVKNPTTQAGLSNDSTLNALKYIVLSGTPTGIALDVNSSDLKNAADNSIIGYADHYDSVNKRLYFHQNLSSGYKELPPTGSIKIGDNTEPYSYTSINNGEFINDGNAEVLFTENRSFITRASGQTEDLILIIQF